MASLFFAYKTWCIIALKTNNFNKKLLAQNEQMQRMLRDMNSQDEAVKKK